MARRKLKFNLSSTEIKELITVMGKPDVNPAMAQRCRIILLTEEGVPLQEIADVLGLSKTTVNAWRQIFNERRMEGFMDRRRPGRPPKPAKKLPETPFQHVGKRVYFHACESCTTHEMCCPAFD